jgi:acetoin utilization protein AcuB
MLVGKRMTKNPVTVGPDDTLAVADVRMKAGNFRRLPVVDKGKLVGILSQYDLKNYSDCFGSILVKTAMTADPVTVSFSATLEHATSLLSKHNIGALPVVDRGNLVGIIVASDLWVPEPRPLPEWIPRGSH